MDDTWANYRAVREFDWLQKKPSHMVSAVWKKAFSEEGEILRVRWLVIDRAQ
jgi:hypothetical protein